MKELLETWEAMPLIVHFTALMGLILLTMAIFSLRNSLSPHRNCLVVQFDSEEKRDQWSELSKSLDQDEHALATRTLQNFITFCDEERPAPLQRPT